MSKKTITILFIVSTVLGFGDIIGFVIASILFATNYASNNCSLFNPACMASESAIDLLGVSIGLLTAAVGGMLYLIAWIGSLVKQGKQQQWGWFAANLIAWFMGVGWIYMVVYLIAVPETQLAISPVFMPVQLYSAYPQYPPQQPYTTYSQYPPQQSYSPPPQYPPQPYSSYPQNPQQ